MNLTSWSPRVVFRIVFCVCKQCCTAHFTVLSCVFLGNYGRQFATLVSSLVWKWKFNVQLVNLILIRIIPCGLDSFQNNSSSKIREFLISLPSLVCGTGVMVQNVGGPEMEAPVELDSSLAYKMTSPLEFSFSCFCVTELWAVSVVTTVPLWGVGVRKEGSPPPLHITHKHTSWLFTLFTRTFCHIISCFYWHQQKPAVEKWN